MMELKSERLLLREYEEADWKMPPYSKLDYVSIYET
jgi:hypothetical protein